MPFFYAFFSFPRQFVSIFCVHLDAFHTQITSQLAPYHKQIINYVCMAKKKDMQLWVKRNFFCNLIFLLWFFFFVWFLNIKFSFFWVLSSGYWNVNTFVLQYQVIWGFLYWMCISYSWNFRSSIDFYFLFV